MDTLETQKQFGLWWACHSISRLKSLIQRDSDPKCRNNIVVFTNNNAKHIGETVLTRFPNNFETNIHQKIEPSVNHQHLHASWGFPPNIVLRGHGRVRPSHPGPPSPQGAAGPRNRGLWGLPSAAVSSLGSRGPRPSHGQNPTERRGEKFGENFGHLKSWSFGNCGHSKILPGLKERCGFEDVLMTWSWLKNDEKSVGYLTFQAKVTPFSLHIWRLHHMLMIHLYEDQKLPPFALCWGGKPKRVVGCLSSDPKAFSVRNATLQAKVTPFSLHIWRLHHMLMIHLYEDQKLPSISTIRRRTHTFLKHQPQSKRCQAFFGMPRRSNSRNFAKTWEKTVTAWSISFLVLWFRDGRNWSAELSWI